MSSLSSRNQKILAKIHQDPSGDKVLALVDPELVGETLIHPQTRKKIILTESFYGGKAIDAEIALKLLFSYANVNAFGSIIELAIEKGRLDGDVPIWFELASDPNRKVPHLMIFDVSLPKKSLKSKLL